MPWTALVSVLAGLDGGAADLPVLLKAARVSSRANSGPCNRFMLVLLPLVRSGVGDDKEDDTRARSDCLAAGSSGRGQMGSR
jgi:hypothetical protein